MLSSVVLDAIRRSLKADNLAAQRHAEFAEAERLFQGASADRERARVDCAQALHHVEGALTIEIDGQEVFVSGGRVVPATRGTP